MSISAGNEMERNFRRAAANCTRAAYAPHSHGVAPARCVYFEQVTVDSAHIQDAFAFDKVLSNIK